MLRKIGVVLNNAASRMEQRKEKSRATPRYVKSNPIYAKIHFLGNQDQRWYLVHLKFGQRGSDFGIVSPDQIKKDL
jgi:hypothetical protein